MRRPELRPSLQPGRPAAVLVRNGEMSAQAEGDTESDAGGSGRRGIAGSLAALLTGSAHCSGAMLVFLDVEGPREEASTFAPVSRVPANESGSRSADQSAVHSRLS